MSDEKTRIIPRNKAEPAPVPATAPAPPQRVGDKIVFYCPNGDKVVVPAKYAGKRGLCTKCKVPVVIPNLGGKRPAKPVFPGAEPPPPAEDEVAGDEAAEVQAEAGPVEPAVVEEPPAVADAVADPAPASPAPAAPPAEEWKFVTDVEGSHAGFEPQPSAYGEPPPPPAFGDAGQAGEHPAARLAARLWMERDQGGIFELHLSGGSVILPEWYEPNWSRGSHGLFASQAADGSITLTAVAWDTIEKIVVRQVPAVPDGMFE